MVWVALHDVCGMGGRAPPRLAGVQRDRVTARSGGSHAVAPQTECAAAVEGQHLPQRVIVHQLPAGLWRRSSVDRRISAAGRWGEGWQEGGGGGQNPGQPLDKRGGGGPTAHLVSGGDALNCPSQYALRYMGHV